VANPSESSSSIINRWTCPSGHLWEAPAARPCPLCGKAPSPDEEDSPNTTVVGRRPRYARPVSELDGLPDVPGFEVLEELGRGGMGVVYKARQKGLNRLVALKMLLPGAREPRRFRQEAEAVARLQHPNIVQIYDIGEWEPAPGRPKVAYFSMEYCPGGTLSRALAGTPLLPNDAAVLVCRVARAVQHAHEQGIIHRDLKPANVLLGGRSEPPSERSASTDGPYRRERSDHTLGPLAAIQPKVADFGLARKLDEQGITITGEVMGTPAYMSPEQAEGKKDIGPAADVYSLGAMLYACLTGRPPFQAATALDVLFQVVNDEPVPARRLNRQVPVDLETICHKCLQKAPSRRYASAAELADDLERFLDGKPILARPLGAVENFLRWVWRYPVMSSLIAVLVVVAISTAVLAIIGEHQRLILAVYINRLVDETERQRAELVVWRKRLEDVKLDAEQATNNRKALNRQLQEVEREIAVADAGKLSGLQREKGRFREQYHRAEKLEIQMTERLQRAAADLKYREEQVAILEKILPPREQRPPRPPQEHMQRDER
jgi:serine/threonine protein kinase